MPEIILPRRRFLQAVVGLIAAPAVVKIDNLMRLSAPRRLLIEPQWEAYTSHFYWDAQHVPTDWRYVARISNIDTGELISSTQSAGFVRVMHLERPEEAVCVSVSYERRSDDV